MSSVWNDLLECGIPWKSDRGGNLWCGRSGTCQRLPDPAEDHDVVFRTGCFSGSSDKMKTLKKVVTHPCILACVLGIILMVTGLPLPLGLDGAVTAVGNCNTAMSMMVIGMILADIDLKDFWDWTVVKYTVHRLVVIPAVVYIVCSFLPLNKTVLGLCVLLAAMPAGATTSILAEKYQVDSPFATKMVIFPRCCHCRRSVCGVSSCSRRSRREFVIMHRVLYMDMLK